MIRQICVELALLDWSRGFEAESAISGRTGRSQNCYFPPKRLPHPGRQQDTYYAVKSMAALDIGLSTRESLAKIKVPEIEATLMHVGSGSKRSPCDGDADCTASYQVGAATSDGRRFRVLRPHARGGLGAVFVALDEELHREV
jgi:hypothetical protein